MSSIPSDFNNLSAFTAARNFNYASASNSDDDVPFIDHFQAAAPAAQPTEANQPNQNSSSSNLANGPTPAPSSDPTATSSNDLATPGSNDSTSASSNEPNTPTDNTSATRSPTDGKPVKKSTAENKTKHDDDSTNATPTGSTAAEQPATPPVAANQPTAIAKEVTVADDNAASESSGDANSTASGGTKTAADGTGNTPAAAATASTGATAAIVAASGAASQKIVASAAASAADAKTTDSHGSKKSAKTTEPTTAAAAGTGAIAPQAAASQEAATPTTAAGQAATTQSASPQDAATTTAATQAAATQATTAIQSKANVAQLTGKKETPLAANAKSKKADATDAVTPTTVDVAKPANTAANPSASAAVAAPESTSPVPDSSTAPAAAASPTNDKNQGSQSALLDATTVSITPPPGAVPVLPPTPTVSNSAGKDASTPAIGPPTTSSNPTPAPTSNVDPSGANVPRFAANLLGPGTSSTANSSQLSGVDQARFIQRVANAFQAAQDKDGEISLRLSPPELGSMKLEVKVQDGVMTARMETESESTKTLLVDNLPALRERLADQGIRVDKFDVDVMNQQSNGNGANNMPRGDDREAAQANTPRLPRETNNAKPSDPPPATRVPRATDGRLNVVV